MISRLRPELIQAVAALVALTTGALVYLLDRSSADTYLIPDSWKFGERVPPVFGALGAHWPTFAHTLAFILFTSALLGSRRRAAGIACVSWGIVAGLFEIAQHETWARAIADRVPGWFARWPVLENVAGYFLAGRFDVVDLLSIGVAIVVAYGLIRWSRRIGARPVAMRG